MSQERHLSEAEISAYLSAGPDVWSETDSGTESHLEECESCRSKALEMHRDQMGFRKAGRMTRDCPEDEILQQVAAGGSEPGIAATTMDHAARCSHCGSRLKKLANIFSGDLSPEQQKIMAQLQTSKREWQRDFIRDYVKPRGASVKSAKPARFASDKPGLWTQIFGTWWGRAVMAGATAAIVLAAVFEGPVLSAKYELHRAQGLVAAASQERRTTEVHFSGAPYSDYKPYPTVLGPDDDRGLDVNRPELMKAEGTVADKVKGQDPRWLQLQGRISLLEDTPKSIAQAQKYFEEAQRKGLNTPSLKIDLASSYYEHDVRAEYPNLQRTLDLLLEVLHQPNLSTEDKAAALFDLGIAYEKTQAWDLAASTWEDYLRVDSSSAWAEQARDRLKKAKEKIPAHRQQGYESPSYFLEQVSTKNLRPEDVEQYFQRAVSSWLIPAVGDRGSDFYRASMALADVLSKEHDDPLLKDFLRSASSSDLDAVRALSAASLANEKGLHNDALTQADRATTLLDKNRNAAGNLLARYEQVYALRSMLQGKNCLARASPLLTALSSTKYHWLQGQLFLEEAQCENFQSQLAESETDSEASLSIAREFHYPVLILRDIGISAGMKRQQRDYDQSWNDGVQGLSLYWKAMYPPDRLDQFYASMAQCAEESGHLHAAEALFRRTLASRESPETRIPKNVIREAMLHLELANILKAREENDSSENEARKAASLFDTANEGYVADYRLTSNLNPAEVQSRHEKAELALTTLKAMESSVRRSQDTVISLSYYRLLGSVYLKLGNNEEAVDAFRSAVDIAERPLQSLNSARGRQDWLRATDESYRGLVRSLLAQKKDTLALEEWEWYKSRPLLNPSSDLNSQGVEPESRSKKQPSGFLPHALQTRLIYATFPDGLQIWVMKPDAVHSSWVKISEGNLESAIRDFVGRCAKSDSNPQELRRESSKLYSYFVGPIISALPSQQTTVVVELDRSLGGFPLEALVTTDGQFFAEHYQLVYSPGLSLERDLRTPAPVQLGDELVLLDASQSGQSGFLPGIEAERKVITGLFPRTTVFDAAKTNWAEIRPSLAVSEIFHYVGHGKPSGTGTGLILRENELLTAKDFTPDLLKHSQLAVLSACSTGVGEKDGLLDTDNLVRAFFSAGVPRVVSSRWDVDSNSTSRLMSSFYRHLGNHESVARALFSAQREELAANPHPYYWAGFSLTGRTD